MASDLFEAALTVTTPASARCILSFLPATLSATVRMPELREVGIFSQSGVACQVGLGTAAAAGTTASGNVTVQNSQGGAGSTQVIPTWSTYPTAPTTYTRRFDIQAVSGAGVIFTWLPGEWPLWSGAATPFIIYQISTAAVTLDLYVKVAE